MQTIPLIASISIFLVIIFIMCLHIKKRNKKIKTLQHHIDTAVIMNTKRKKEAQTKIDNLQKDKHELIARLNNLPVKSLRYLHFITPDGEIARNVTCKSYFNPKGDLLSVKCSIRKKNKKTNKYDRIKVTPSIHKY